MGRSRGDPRSKLVPAVGARPSSWRAAVALRVDAAREPLVSCLVPTRDRPAFVALAIRWYDTQRWANKELVVVDGSAAPAAPVAPRDDIRVIRADPTLSLGAQRNLAVAHARGDVLISWDDDDWYGPDRIARQVSALRAGAAVTALTLDHVVELPRGRWFRAVSRSGSPSGAPALGTLAWTRAVTDAGVRFDPAGAREDVGFLAACRERRLPFRVEPAAGSWVHCRHGANTNPLDLHGRGFGASRPPAGFPDEALRLLRSVAEAPSTPPPVPSLPVGTGASAPARTVSVLMTAYRTAPYVEAAIRSVLTQDLAPGWSLELLVGVDGCAETAAAVARIDDPRVVRVELAENGGTYRALNTLIGLASGEVLAVLDSDDVAAPGRLRAPLAALDEDPTLAWVGGQRIPVDADLQPIGPPSRFPEAPGPAFLAGGNCTTSHGALTVRRSVFDRLGGYDDTRMGGDTDLVIRALAAGLAGRNLPVALHWYRQRPGQLTTAPGTAIGAPARTAYAKGLAERWRRYRAGEVPPRLQPACTPVARVVRGARPRVVAILPTIPARVAGASRVIDAVLAQPVDRVVVLLHGHDIPPALPDDPRLVIRRNPAGTGPAVRFDEPVGGFDVAVYLDDDLVYPADYVARTLTHLARVGPGWVVTYHAHYWPSGGGGAYAEARRICLWDAADRDHQVPYGGAGVTAVPAALVPALAGPRPRVFDREDDAWLAGRLWAVGARIVRPATDAGWLRSTPLGAGPDALYQRARAEGFATRTAALAYAAAAWGWRPTDLAPLPVTAART